MIGDSRGQSAGHRKEIHHVHDPDSWAGSAGPAPTHLDLSQRRALLEPSQYSDQDRFPLPEADSDYFPMVLQLGDLFNLDEDRQRDPPPAQRGPDKERVLDAPGSSPVATRCSPAELEQAVAESAIQEALEGE